MKIYILHYLPTHGLTGVFNLMLFTFAVNRASILVHSCVFWSTIDENSDSYILQIEIYYIKLLFRVFFLL